MTNLFSRFDLRLVGVGLAFLGFAASGLDITPVWLMAGGIVTIGLALLPRAPSGISREVLDTVRALGAGDMERRITPLPDDPASRELALAVNHAMDTVDSYVRESKASMGHVAQGKYYRKIIQQGLPGAFGYAAGTVNEATDSIKCKIDRFQNLTSSFEDRVVGVATTITGSADSFDKAARRVVDSVREVVFSRSRADSIPDLDEDPNIDLVVETVEEFAESIASVSQQIEESRDRINNASTQAREAVDAIRRLTGVAEQIGSTVDAIRQISAQTNMLALNAGIEASRAGDQGKGFAVVAERVKDLAGETDKASLDIGARINETREVIEIVAKSIDGFEQTMDSVLQTSGNISGSVEDQHGSIYDLSSKMVAVAHTARNLSATLKDVLEEYLEAAQAA